ncbi:hypothetical protein [uncultured Methylobacterium sp.]|uniref:hypothetical protein n=1 Tax=uncultured Methylobacterium sp. TaxID=157278 RepID=UPI0035CBB61F
MRFAILPTLLAAVLSAAFPRPACPQVSAKPAPKAAPAVQGPVSAPVIGCPSLANYRLLRRETAGAAAAARLADPKADHLGCVAFPRDRVAALADHVALGGEAYDCLSLQGTAVCHWTAAGTVSPPARTAPKPPPADRTRR